jgi:hypothetical protein
MLYVLVIDQVCLYSQFWHTFSDARNLSYNHIQALYYFRHYTSDRVLIKAMVALLALCDTIAVAGVCAEAYLVSTPVLLPEQLN